MFPHLPVPVLQLVIKSAGQRVKVPNSPPSSLLRFALMMLTWVALCVGCGNSATTTDATTYKGDVFGVDTISEKSCESNRDCAGGEVCRDDVCRRACETSDDCAAPTPACDEAAGYCVACLRPADCGPNETCTDRSCAFFCSVDEACPPTSFCDLSTGACAKRECESSRDCFGGYQCELFQCVPIDPIICEAGTVRCDTTANAIGSCNADGTRETFVSCGEGRSCMVQESGVVCAEVACEPNALGCDDVTHAFECDATGTVKIVTACPNGRRCSEGVCLAQVCVPRATRCDGAGIRICAADGLSESFSECAVDPTCAASAYGCACIADQCTPRTCNPGSTRCAGIGIQTCAPDGQSWEASIACPGSESCLVEFGACVPPK